MANKSFISSLVVFLIAIALMAIISQRGEPVVIETKLEKFPVEIDGYKAAEDVFPESVYKELNADKHVYRHYRSNADKELNLYIGYYGTAKGGRSAHNPYGCLPGAGWGILDSGEVAIRTKYYSEPVHVNHILAQKGKFYLIVLHWYQSAGTKVLATGIQQNIQRFAGKLLNNRNDGAFIQVSMVSGEDEINEANLLVGAFAEKVLDLIPHYWPTEP